MAIRVYFWCNEDDPLTYNRMMLPAMALRDRGWRVHVSNKLTPAVTKADIIVAADRDDESLPIAAWFAKQAGMPLLVDTPGKVKDARTEERAADVLKFPTFVAKEQLDFRPRAKRHKTIGWVGQHQEDAQLIATVVKKMNRQYDTEFRTVGMRNNMGLPNRYKHLYAPNNYPDFYKTLSFDVALSPHHREPANPHYTDLLMVSYAAAGVPVVATESRGTRFVSHGFNGLIAQENQPWRLYHWDRFVENLVCDENKRRTLIERGKTMAEYRTIEYHIERYEEAISKYWFANPRRDLMEKMFEGGTEWLQETAFTANVA